MYVMGESPDDIMARLIREGVFEDGSSGKSIKFTKRFIGLMRLAIPKVSDDSSRPIEDASIIAYITLRGEVDIDELTSSVTAIMSMVRLVEDDEHRELRMMFRFKENL